MSGSAPSLDYAENQRYLVLDDLLTEAFSPIINSREVSIYSENGNKYLDKNELMEFLSRSLPSNKQKYSPLILKNYDKERHISLNDAYSLIENQEDQNFSVEKIKSAIDKREIKLYEFDNGKHLDRLDIGRAFNTPKENPQGMTIDRYFSEEHKNPYDSIEYSRKNLEIKHKDGSVVFEMDDAEFPTTWDNDVHAQIVAQKYFYKPHKEQWKQKLKNKIGIEYENSLKHLVTRVTNFFTDEGWKLGYFVSEKDREIFRDELATLQIQGKIAFNSPVQFNAGLYNEYKIEGSPGINYYKDPKTRNVVKVEGGSNIHPQCHACFIKGPKDDLESISMHAVHETGIFSSGSGIGQDIGILRAKGEKLSGGGNASGPISFWKFYDDVGGTVKSGGKSRRAARMTTMRYYHPDIEEFIDSKWGADKKALILMENGIESGMDGEAYATVPFQNTNISVRLDDYFFDQVKKDGKIKLINVSNGEFAKEISAKLLLEKISYGAWRVGDPGVQYEDTIQFWHTAKNSGRINSSNPCSEYMFLDDTSCNLGSINILKFTDNKGTLDVPSFKKASNITSIALDIANKAASYPVRDIAQISPEFATIGLGYANIGALLMRKGLSYNSEEGRNLVGAITALMTGASYETSVELANNLGTFEHYNFNKKPMMEVVRNHKKSLDDIVWEGVQEDLKEATYNSWDNVVEQGEKHGFRNAQATVIAPTGTISYLMNCDTTGIEPSIALIIYKNLAGKGYVELVNNEVPNALKNLGYNENQIKDISNFVKEKLADGKPRNSVIGAPHLHPTHYEVFNTAMGDGRGNATIPFNAHVKMLAAVQPFVSGAISKTNNLPNQATVKDNYDGFILGHELGLKALATFRDGGKPISALDFGEENHVKLKRGEKEDLLNRRSAFEVEVKIGETPFHIIASEYKNGKPGQITFLSYKAGSDLKALYENMGVMASSALKRGVCLEDVVKGWIGQKFQPNGLVHGYPWIKEAVSPLDFAARVLLLEYMGNTDVINPELREGILFEDLRGAKKGSFKTYQKEKVDEWDFNHVMNDPDLGGFKINGSNVPIPENDKAKISKNIARGVECHNCGHPMKQTGPTCFECLTCGGTRGGCAQ